MLYKYDTIAMQFVRVKWHQLLKSRLIIIAIIAGILASVVFNVLMVKLNKTLEEQQMILIIAKQNQFDNEKLVNKIKDMNFQFPHIVYAQTLLETDSFNSHIFKENNNLFGMKMATKRINLAHGIQNEHAYYDNWMESLYDYALYYSTYLYRLQTEEEYFSYLSQFYAEDYNYVQKLRNIIVIRNLKSKFQ